MICDLHTHTCFSDGRLPPEEVAAIAGSKGYKVGISDHCGWGSFQINRDEHFKQYLESLAGLPVFRSAELDLGTEILISRRLLDECDYLIGGVHSLNGLDFFDADAVLPEARSLAQGMLDLIESKAREFGFHILAHPGLLPIAYRKDREKILDKKWSQRLITLAKEYNFALEISSRWELPLADTIKSALDAGVTFSLGSDGHCRETVCRLDHSLSLINQLNVPWDRIFSGRHSTRR